MQQAGVQIVRYYLWWANIQASPDSSYNWTNSDAVLQTLAAHHLDVDVMLTGNPTWAAASDNGPVDRAPLATYYAFATAAATRYGQAPYTVREWEIYNEEDFTAYWGGQGRDYATLLHQIYPRIKAAAPDMPGLGIVAAVLGVVITMGALGGPPEEIGHKVAAALVGTFLGILLCYGLVGPLAASMQKTAEEEGAYLHVLRVVMISFLKGNAPIMAVEFARRAIPGHVRPTFIEVEKHCKKSADAAPDAAEGAAEKAPEASAAASA